MNFFRLNAFIILFVFITIIQIPDFAQADNSIVKIGVLAKRGPEKAMEKWGPTAQYLTATLQNQTFIIVPLSFEEVHTSVAKAGIDFLITNSGDYVLLVGNFQGLSRIATMKNRWHDKGYAMFGGVIFTRKDNNTINNFFDLRGKTFMAVDRNSFGGWLMARFELHKSGMDPDKSFKNLFFGKTHDKVVFAVKNRIVDAGTVRTDTLERMAAEGKIDLNDFKIIHSKPANKYFPFVRSTDLYPEWPFARLSHTSYELAEKVTLALLNMPAQSPAADAARISGWTIPLDYRPVHNLLRELKIGQYQDSGRISMMDMVKKYWKWIMAVFLLMVFITGTSFYVSILNKKLKETHSKLEKANEELKSKVEQRSKEVLESERKYRELADFLPQVVFELDETGNILYVNQNAFDVFKYTKDQLDKGLNVLQMIIPEDHDRVMEDIQRLLKGDHIGGVEYTAVRCDNTTFPVVIHSNLVTHNGKPTGFRGLLIDISRQKRMEKDLKHRALAIDHSSDTIVITDTDGIITYVNPAFEKISGYSCEEALGQNPRILQSGDHDESFYRELWETLSNGKTWSGRFVNEKKDGSQYIEDATISPVFSDKGEIISYVAVKRDVSEQLKLETRLRQAHKMESIGTLAGGIAHDFNNILSGILGYSELAALNIEDPEKAKKNISQIVKGAQRAAELVQQILTFSRQTEYQKQPLKFYIIVKEVLKLLRPSIPATIDIKDDIVSRAVVLADSSQMHQVILNLCTNAYQSMGKKGGILTVRLSEIEISEPDSLPDLNQLPGIYLKLEVKDTGCGMDKKTLGKAFDPYFTTKKEGKGTGFGLALVQAIVEEHNGYVNAYSEIDKGSIFNVYLPIVEEKTDLFTKEQKKEGLTGGTEKIMIVDDEEDVRKGTQELLESCGYKVSSFCNGIEALQEFEKNPHRFDLIITDMTMPKMTGLELSTKILNIRKDMPIILSTGYYENLTKDMVHRVGIRKYIQKPVMSQKLLSMIREILNKKEV